MESLYYVRKTIGDRVVTAGFERIEGLGWCWLMDYVCSNGCSVIITRKREAKNPFFSVAKAARTADEFANTYNEAVARMNGV